jgi:lysophospholipase L1-like esterase
MSKQVQQFAAVQRNISARISQQAADTVLSRSLFLISTGGNDIFAFFSANSTPSSAEMQRFVTNLVSLYTNHVKVKPPFACLSSHNFTAKKHKESN